MILNFFFQHKQFYDSIINQNKCTAIASPEKRVVSFCILQYFESFLNISNEFYSVISYPLFHSLKKQILLLDIAFSRPRENTSSEFKIHVPEGVYMLLWSQVCYCLRTWLHTLWLFVETVTFSSKDEDLLRVKGVDLQQLTQNRSSFSWALKG